MKKRVTIISFLVGVLVLALGIGLFTREEGKKVNTFEDESGNVKVEEIELSFGLIVF